ncbi:MAG: ABC transporter ATP-binding protein [Pseudooceanicola sp.]|nr:ABC transporter ATP-binding protein [Pseudooceanicola sp.]
MSGQTAFTGAAKTGPTLISLKDVVVDFATRDRVVRAVDGISLDMPEGGFTALVGPSGCGKSTVLNMVAGLLKPSAGSVTFEGRPVDGPNTRVGYMTQKDTLLPWRTVEDNVGIAFELRCRRSERGDKAARVAEMIERVGLKGFEKHFPSELSGGMRKRAALARMLIYKPSTLLLDEPFGALDAQLRLIMQKELLELVDASGMTVVLVTHDLEEAVSLADKVVVFTSRPGRIRAVRDIPIPRPRDPATLRFTDAFRDHCAALWDELRDEVAAAMATPHA